MRWRRRRRAPRWAVIASSAAAAAVLATGCAAREWAGDEGTARIDDILGGGEELPDDDAVDGVAVPRQVTQGEGGVSVTVVSKERPHTARGKPTTSAASKKASGAKAAKSKRDDVGRATDLDAIVSKNKP